MSEEYAETYHRCKEEDDRHNDVVQYSWLGEQWFVDDGDYYHRIPIKYCPFCGDKL